MERRKRKKREESPEEIWSRADAVRELKRVVAVSLEAARQETPGEDGAPARVTYNPSAANAATKAIEVLNRLLGYGAPETEEEGDGSLTVLFSEGEEYTQ
ncbi:MAG: hypothetical protein II192_04900 [Clostridia bacterium]|nr:hypothetical protein [Clostridia bacterium]MBQ4298616.1 hypothetical protein [Clostridia bacterium]